MTLFSNFIFGMLIGSTRSTGERDFSGVTGGNCWTIRALSGLNARRRYLSGGVRSRFIFLEWSSNLAVRVGGGVDSTCEITSLVIDEFMLYFIYGYGVSKNRKPDCGR